MTRPAKPGRLALPDAGRALRAPGTPEGGVGARASRRVLSVFGALLALAAVVAVAVPLSRTVALTGQLVPQRTVIVRAAEPGLVHEILVSAGDRVEPGDVVARLRSPELDEAMRTQPHGASSWPLLARLTRLDLHAPDWSRSRANGAADPASIFPGGIVLTERLDERLGAHINAGDALLEIAVADADGRVPLHVEAAAGERQAQRVRAGMPARITIEAVPNEKPRQVDGRVVHVSPAPADADGWRVEIEVDLAELDLVTQIDDASRSTVLRPGFSVEVAVEERRQPIARTVRDWIRTRSSEI